MRTQKTYDGLTERERWLMEAAYNAGAEIAEKDIRVGRKFGTPAVEWFRSTISIPSGDGFMLHGEAGEVLGYAAARRFGVTRTERDVTNEVLVEIRDAIQGIASRISGATA